jgi:CRP-like cAMP-binding protein
MKTIDPKVALLRELPRLAAIRARDLATVAPLVEDLHVADGTALVSEGATCHEVVLILQGRASMSRGGEIVGQVGPGDVLGDLAVRQGTPHETTVTADGPLHVLIAGPESFRAFVRHPVISTVLGAGSPPSAA